MLLEAALCRCLPSEVTAVAPGAWPVGRCGRRCLSVVGSAVAPYAQTNVPLSLAASPVGVWVGTEGGLEHLRITADGVEVDDVAGRR